jgi:hypothetical protein
VGELARAGRPQRDAGEGVCLGGASRRNGHGSGVGTRLDGGISYRCALNHRLFSTIDGGRLCAIRRRLVRAHRGRGQRQGEQHGPEAVGFYISGQLLTEDYYVVNKLVKGLLGSNNIDSNSRLFGYHKEPFRKLCKYYMDLNAYDSAYVVVKNGREILPNDPILNDFTYVLMRYTLDKILPSEDYLKAVERGLKDFPSDSFLNHRENSIYIFLLNGY